MSHVSTVEVGDTTGLVDSGIQKRSRKTRNLARKLAKEREKKARLEAKQRARAAGGGGAGAAPWIVTLALAAAAGFGGYYLFERYQLVSESLAESRGQVATANHRAAEAEDRLMAVEAELARARGEFAQERKKVEAKTAEAEALSARLENLLTKDQGEVVQNENGTLSLHMVDKVLFRLGEAELTDKGRAVLTQVGEALNELPDKQIWVQGHTDDVPVKKDNGKFSSNWELSAARALNVLYYLQNDVKVDPRRLAAVAFGEHRPVSSKRKWKNRRIEIVLAPKDVRIVKD